MSMPSSRLVSAFLAPLLACLLPATSWSMSESCQAPMTAKTLVGSTARLFKDWLCTTVFDTHDEAIDAGIEHGLDVYGVRLTPGASFDRDQRNSWKRSNCPLGWASVNRASALHHLYIALPSGSVEPYVACMNSQRPGLRCSLHQPDAQHVQFSSTWYAPADQLPVLPRVITGSIRLHGVASVPGSLEFSSRPEGVSVPATSGEWSLTGQAARTTGSAVVFDLDSTRGSCIVAPFIAPPPAPPPPPPVPQSERPTATPEKPTDRPRYVPRLPPHIEMKTR